MDDASRRLAQLARILSDARPHGEAATVDPEEHLHRVRLQRIQDFTAQLDDGDGRGIDVADTVAMRLVLDQYFSVVAHLRAAVRERAAVLGSLAAQLRADRRLVDDQVAQQREKPLASTAPSDQRPASQNPDT
jgi:hypothetical protein